FRRVLFRSGAGRVLEDAAVVADEAVAAAAVEPHAGRVALRPHVAHAVEPGGDLRRPARRAGRALLGEDLDHAAGRLGAVQRRGGRTLDDLDALDVRGVDVVEWRGDLPRGRVRGRGAAVDPHAVHVHDRLVALRDAVVAAQPDRAARARPARVLAHLDARGGGGQVVLRVSRGPR